MKKIFENFGIGVDIADVGRFRRKKFQKNKNFYNKIFCKSETDYCLKFKDPYTHFAGKFALKESVIKSIQSNISFLDIQTSNSKHGPVVSIVGNLAKKYLFSASISLETEYAIAAVISFKL